MESLCLNDGTAPQWAGGFVNSLLTKELQTGFAPDGTLRVAINYGIRYLQVDVLRPESRLVFP